MKAFAPAKINLGLEILCKRPDGYHNVDMIMQSIDLFDEIEVLQLSENKIDIIHEYPVDFSAKDDLAYKAASMFLRYVPNQFKGLKIKIRKQIPFSAGLAGGSSDAAAVLMILNHMHKNPLKLQDLMHIGQKIGADVPFCILGGTARAKGKGELLEKIESKLNYFLVLVKPNVSVSTLKAYSMFDSSDDREHKNMDLLECSLKNSNLDEFCFNLFNRFEDFILVDLISSLKNEFIKLGAKSALMSGSGPSVYGIFEDLKSAKKCFNSMKLKYKDVFLCRQIQTGCIIDD